MRENLLFDKYICIIVVVPVIFVEFSRVKGQLISEWILMSSIFQKKQPKNLKDICPEDLKSGLI